jgi:hypothetical protein
MYATYLALVKTADDLVTSIYDGVSFALPEIEVFFPFPLLLSLNCLP